MTDTLDEALRSAYERYSVRGVAIPWFTRSSWPRLLQIAADRADLPETFEAFERLAGERFDRHVADGHALEKILIDVDELAAWCRQLGKPVDAMARSAFAAFVLTRRDLEAGNA